MVLYERKRNREINEIKELKQEKAAQEEMDEFEREKFRRLQGRETQEANESHKKLQIEREAHLKKKAKEDDKKALDRIREEIRIDRLNRLNRGNQSTEPTTNQINQNTTNTVQTNQNTNETVQTNQNTSETGEELIDVLIRFPNNTRHTAKFKTTDTIRDIMTFVNEKNEQNRPYKLMKSYPKKTFEPGELNQKLSEAGITHREVINVSFV